jgi:hypothetical protein
MSQQHVRRKRRPRFQKPDTINIILGSLAVILVFAWGGLYWKESSNQSLVVSADGAALNQYAELQADGVETNIPESTSPAGAVKPAATDQAAKPAEQATEPPAEEGKGATIPEAATTDKPAATDNESNPVQTSKPTTPVKPGQGTGTKPGKGTDAGAGAVAKPTPTPEVPEVTVTPPPVEASAKYEQEIIQVQAKCTQDMNEVLAGADTSIKELDMTDPYAFQELNQKWIDGLTNAENACTAKFEGIIERAEKDEVDSDITEGWEQKFSALMLQLQGDFEAKLLTLMGG